MDEISFFVDELPILSALVALQNDADKLESIVAAAEKVIEAGIGEIRCYSDIYSLQLGDLDVAQILFGAVHDGEVRDLIVRLQVILARTNSCDVDSGVGYARSGIRAAGVGVLITDPSFVPGEWWNAATMHVLSEPSNMSDLIRKLFVYLQLPASALPEFAPLMFDNLHFHVPASKVKDLGLDFELWREAVIHHLAYLNDFAATDFRTIAQNKEIIGNANSRGVDISPDSPKTHANKDAMKERDIVLAGQTIRCEWHTKLDHKTGRIHFFPWIHPHQNVRALVGDKVIVGVITDHLTI